MKDSCIIEREIKLLRGHFYGNIAALAILFLLFIFNLIPLFTEAVAINVTLERYLIMLTIIVIPVSLRLFAQKLKKAVRPMEIASAVKSYKNAYFFRLYSISAITSMHIVLFAFSRNMNFFWFTVVLFIVFVFCKPSFDELQSLTEEPAKDEPIEPQEEEEPHDEVTPTAFNEQENEQIAGK